MNDQNTVYVYPKPNHIPASFTLLNFPVEDIVPAVKELNEKGIQFEKYDSPTKTNDQGIFEDKGMKIAWFKDPAGNILSIIES